MKSKIIKVAVFMVAFILGMQLASVLKAQDNAILWKISGNGLSEESYLYGTLHLLCEDYLNLSPELSGSIQSADKIVMELDMDDPALASEMQKYAGNPDQINLRSMLKKGDAKALDEFLIKHYSTGLDQLGYLRPITLMSMVLVKLLECPIKSYEVSFVELAQAQEKEIVGLETVEFQMSVFEEISQETQLDWIIDMVRDIESQGEIYLKLMSAHKKGDLATIMKLLGETTRDYESYEDILINNRNRNWIAPMEKEMQSQSTIFAVGAGHLGGNQGVVRLLEQRGYTLEPITDQ